MLKWLLSKIIKQKPVEVKQVVVPLFKNQSDRLENEYRFLKDKNPSLHELMQDLIVWSTRELGMPITITMIDRTQAEQDEIYKNDAKYMAKKFKSPHQIAHAVDIRSLTYTPDQIKKTEDYLNEKYNSINIYKWTARNHKVGNGATHFHIQFAKK